MAGVAQLVRAPVCGTGGRRFETGHSPHRLISGMIQRIIILLIFIYPAVATANTQNSYTQQLTKHITRHQHYPESAEIYGIEGYAILHVRLDKSGIILNFGYLKEPTHPLLHAAIIAMLEHANPAPPVPEQYLDSRSSEADFIFPVAFTIGHKPDILAAIDREFRYIVRSFKER